MTRTVLNPKLAPKLPQEQTDIPFGKVVYMLLTAFFPLAVLILAVLGTILFGLATPSEAAAVGALGAMLIAIGYRAMTWQRLKEAVFLTARTSAMVCWLFVGSSIFSAAFALLGGEEIIENWVLSLDLTPVQFMILAQFIIFILGWPLEWTEIIIIFMPIFIPLLPHFGVDPLFFGLLVALNLQTAFLSPPVAMAAFYLKGVSPPHVTLNQIFAGMLPFMAIQVFAVVPAVHVPRRSGCGCLACSTATERCRGTATASMDLSELGAAEAASALAEGRISSEELVASCLERIQADEDRVQAWAFLDPEHALQQARAADERRREGKPLGALHGVPVGVKDIIDTADMPTENGTVLHAGRTPAEDATVVRMLRAAGAVIMGKTVTTELATYAPGKTRNPHNPEHTPGGFFQRLGRRGGGAHGAAGDRHPDQRLDDPAGGLLRRGRVQAELRADLAARRPEAIRGARPGGRVRAQRRGRGLAGGAAHRLRRARPGYPAAGEDRCCAKLRRRSRRLPPHLAFVKTPMWKMADAESHEAFAELVSHLGEHVEEFQLPPAFKDAWKWHQTIMEADIAVNYEAEYERGKDKLSESLRGQIERGRKVRAVDYNKALDRDSGAQCGAEGTVRTALRSDPDARRRPARRRGDWSRPDRRCSAPSGRCAACRRSRCR